MKQLKKYQYVLFVMAATVSSASYAEIYATVSKNQVAENELFQLQIVTDQQASSEDLNFDVLNRDFSVSRPSFGTSLNIINGKRSSKCQWTVTIAATTSGIVRIPSFTLNGEKTQPIAIQVVKDQAAPQTNDLVQIHTQFDKTSLYPNESTLMHVRLEIYANTRRLQNPQIKPPKADGVDLQSASEPDQKTEIINGVSTTVISQDFRITATQPGQFKVTEPQFNSSMYYNDMHGNTRVMPLKTNAHTYTITVQEKPSQYIGTWLPTSKLTLTDQWQDGDGKTIHSDPIALKVGDSITRLVTLEVNGVTQERIPNFTLRYPDSLRVYKEKPKYKNLGNGDLKITLKQVIIPSQAGTYNLPGLTVNWWDTVNQKQRKSLILGKQLRVTGNLAGTTIQSAEKNTKPAQSQRTAPISPAISPKPTQVRDSGIWPYLTGLFALLWILTAGVFGYTMQKKRSSKAQISSLRYSPQNQTTVQALIQAINNHDGILMNQYYKEWLEVIDIDEEERTLLDSSIKQMQASLYAKGATPFDNKSLIKLIQRINKKKRRVKKEHKLPSL